METIDAPSLLWYYFDVVELQPTLLLFPYQQEYKFGKELQKQVNTNMEGVCVSDGNNAGIIAGCVAACSGNHLDIGTFFGGTAIIAAVAKKVFGQTGRIVTLDTYTPNIKTLVRVPTLALVRKNLQTWQVSNLVDAIQIDGHPWPLSGLFDTAYIDGDHGPSVRQDWEVCSRIVRRYIIFDDVCGRWPYPLHTFWDACKHPDWRPVFMSGVVGVVERYD